MANNEIAVRLGTSPQVVHRWRKRFSEDGIDGLADRDRSGRPRVFGAEVVMEVKALACELPAVTASRCRAGAVRSWPASWSRERWCPQSRQRPFGALFARTPSALGTYRSWIAPRDPDFAVKAARVLDLYASCFEDQVLGDNEFVISADEKASIQARCRCHPTLPPGRARLIRVEHEYERGGALAYLAAYDVHRATDLGRCEDTTGIVTGSPLGLRSPR